MPSSRTMRVLTHAFAPPTPLRRPRRPRLFSRTTTTSNATPPPTPSINPSAPKLTEPAPFRRLRKGDTINLRISKLAYGGASVGYVPSNPLLVPEDVGMPVYAPKGACPGDLTLCQITRVRRREGDRCYAEAMFVESVQVSEKAIEVPCKHFGNHRLGGGGCGGCSSMQLPYHMQIQEKWAQVASLFGGLADAGVEVGKVIESEKRFGYRNKMEFSFGRRWYEKLGAVDEVGGLEGPGEFEYALGLHSPGRFDKIVRVDECWIQEGIGNEILRYVKERCPKLRLDAYDTKMKLGYMRNLVIRTARNKEGKLELMVNFITSQCYVPLRLVPLATEIMDKFPEVVCVLQNITGVNGTHVIEEDMERLLAGERRYIEQDMCGLTFRISANSFFQTNAPQAAVLYEEVRKAAKLTKEDTLLDLFCGTGTIGLALASEAANVLGIDFIQTAVEDARMNAKLNGITNAVFEQGNLDKLSAVLKSANFPDTDVIIVDPPRAGLHPDLVKFLARCNAKRIVYVSCNPVSQTRDITLIQDISPGRFQITSIQPVDMFPNTPHVECVVTLERV